MATKQTRTTPVVDILVVDDSIASLKLLAEILTQAGYQVRPAERSQLALESALAHPPSLILLDVRMPEMSGFELCRRLKQDKRTSDIPVIFVSALHEVQDRIQGFEVGGVDFISKPIQELEVLARVKTHLQLYTMQLDLEVLVAERTAELAQAHEALRRDIAEQSPSAIFINKKGRLVFVNRKSEQITGYSQEELTSPDFDFLTLFASESRELAERSFARHMRGEEVQPYEYTLLTNAGRRLAVITTTKLINYEGERAILGTVTDITHQKQIETSLRESESLLRTIADNYPAFLSIIEMDEKGVMTVDYVTGKAYSRLNVDPQSYIGLAIEEILEEQAPTVREYYLKAFRGEEASFELSSGDEHFLYTIIPLITNEHGQVARILTVVENITDRKRLEAREQEAAILEERDRLARDLHDSVTQTLFSASMVAEAVPDLWETDPDTGRQYMEQLPWMLRGALAEMRTLLLELRPGALGDQSLGQLLESLAESIRTRSGATVALKVVGDRSLPDDVTVALYRIAQESLNNIAKHAEAGQIAIWLQGDPTGVELHISDDGRGFQPESIAPGHMGVGIMSERAEQVGATLKIDSGPGRGTMVIVTWSDQLNME